MESLDIITARVPAYCVRRNLPISTEATSIYCATSTVKKLSCRRQTHRRRKLLGQIRRLFGFCGAQLSLTGPPSFERRSAGKSLYITADVKSVSTGNVEAEAVLAIRPGRP